MMRRHHVRGPHPTHQKATFAGLPLPLPPSSSVSGRLHCTRLSCSPFQEDASQVKSRVSRSRSLCFLERGGHDRKMPHSRIRERARGRMAPGCLDLDSRHTCQSRFQQVIFHSLWHGLCRSLKLSLKHQEKHRPSDGSACWRWFY